MVNGIRYFFILTAVLLFYGCASDMSSKFDYHTKVWLKSNVEERKTFKVYCENDCINILEKDFQVLSVIDSVVIIKASAEEILKLSSLKCVKYIEMERKLNLKE